MVTDGRDHFKSFQNVGDLVVYILVCICEYYYWGTGKIENGYYIPEENSYFEVFFLPTILFLHLNLIL